MSTPATTTSIEDILGMVVANTRVQDTSYLYDARRWITTGMGLMKTRCTLVSAFEWVNIEFHKGGVPCGCKSIKAIEYQGRRIPEGNSVETYGIPEENEHRQVEKGTTNGFEFVPQIYDAPFQPNPQENSTIYTQDLVPPHHNDGGDDMSKDYHHWYQVELDTITTNVHTGVFGVHFRQIPLDANGWPKIPDNMDYHMALYYFVRAQMIGAGFEDKVFTYDKIMMQSPDPSRAGYFWQHAARAMGQIRYPSTSSMEFKVNEHVRLIKDENYFDRFNLSNFEERKYGYNEYLNNRGVNPKTYLNKDRPSGQNFPTTPGSFNTDFNNDFS